MTFDEENDDIATVDGYEDGYGEDLGGDCEVCGREAGPEPDRCHRHLRADGYGALAAQVDTSVHHSKTGCGPSSAAKASKPKRKQKGPNP